MSAVASADLIGDERCLMVRGESVGAGGLAGAAKALPTKLVLMFHDENDELHFVYPGSKESGCYHRVSDAKVQKLRCYLAIALVRPAPPAPGGSG